VPVRFLWIVLSLLIVVGLTAWSTTCTGERPRSTGQTLPPGEATETTTTATTSRSTVPLP
jgi:hypothetical protein